MQALVWRVSRKWLFEGSATNDGCCKDVLGCIPEGSSMQQPMAAWQLRQTEQTVYKRSLLAPSCMKRHPLRRHGGPDCSLMMQPLQLRLPLALSWCSTAPLLFRKATTSLCLWRTASMMGVPLYLGAGKQPINNPIMRHAALPGSTCSSRAPSHRQARCHVLLHLEHVLLGSACSLGDGCLDTAACSGSFLQKVGRQPCS